MLVHQVVHVVPGVTSTKEGFLQQTKFYTCACAEELEGKEAAKEHIKAGNAALEDSFDWMHEV